MGLAYKPSSFWLVMLDAVYQSLVIFFIAAGAYAGSDIDIWEFGTTITISCLYTCLVQGAILIRSWVKSNYFISIDRNSIIELMQNLRQFFKINSIFLAIFRRFYTLPRLLSACYHSTYSQWRTMVSVLPALVFHQLIGWYFNVCNRQFIGPSLYWRWWFVYFPSKTDWRQKWMNFIILFITINIFLCFVHLFI